MNDKKYCVITFLFNGEPFQITLIFYSIRKENFMNLNKLDIFIGTHKTFEPKVSNDCYKIVVGNHKIENDSNLELIQCGNKDDVLDDRFYSEIYMLRWVAKNYPLKEYVGFCHNRKYFSFMDDVPNVEEVLKENDAILGRPFKRESSNMREFYKICHNIEDLNIIENIIDEKFKEYSKGMREFLYGKMMFPYNMFIMKREDFLEYINFIGSVLDEYVKIVGTDIVKRIEDNKEKYLKNFYPNDTIEYQYRIGGYLAERLTTVFALTKFKKIATCGITITEQKY